jgi:signal transduction histidine kinase
MGFLTNGPDNVTLTTRKTYGMKSSGMEKMRQLQDQVARSRRLPWLVIGLTLAVLAGAILAGCLRLRERVREQLANRDGVAFDQVALWEQQYGDEAGQEMVTTIDDPAEQFNLAMKISRIRGVLGIRLFSADGKFNTAFPASITESTLSAGDLARLTALKPVSHYYPAADLGALDVLSQLDTSSAGKRVPLLEVNVPLHAPDREQLAGVAQFITDGEGLARDYAALDEHLFLQAGVTFLAAGGIMTLALGLAFARLQRANRLLSERTERLSQANQELVLAAKSSAIGAVTSHLIHGLKNPLSGLQGFVKSHVSGTADAESDWQDAVATTERMQTLIGGVVRILEEQQSGGSYEISLRELVEIVAAKMLPVARAAGVHFFTKLTTDATLTNRDANLAILILENLIQNAFQATPEGKAVHLTVTRADGRIHCEVRDEGAGIPEERQEGLFKPCRSQKEGGSGIGLAISRQLATQIGATLELGSNSPNGCVFRLSLPPTLAAEGHLGRGEAVSN